MALTETQKLLIACLKKYGLSKEESTGVMLLLGSKENHEELLDWIRNHVQTDRRIFFLQVYKIAGVTGL